MYMKKVSALMLMTLLAFFLAACGNESASEDKSSTDEPKNAATTEEEKTKDAETEENASETEDTGSAESQAEFMEGVEDVSDVELTLGVEKTYLWEDDASGIKYLSYYAGVENESDKAVDIGAASVTFKNEDDGSIATVSNTVSVAPNVIGPGEIAYVTVNEPAGDLEIDTNVSAELGIDLIPATAEVQWLDFTNVNGKVKGTGLNVTAEVENTTGEKQEEVSTVVGVYSGDEFLGVLEGGVETSLDADAKSGVEMFYPPFPTEAAAKADSFEGAAYSIKYQE
ncbi:hypothetical protein [Terribacillus sp. JSM ZJ617]|uniref:hypothetical protein n=1 Tax=Terribacillus sp. JSM ZJ617 TaxID=3342119 RepID=UPI0035A8FAE4